MPLVRVDVPAGNLERMFLAAEACPFCGGLIYLPPLPLAGPDLEPVARCLCQLCGAELVLAPLTVRRLVCLPE